MMMDEEQQYDKVCKGRFDVIDSKLDNITRRLFYDQDGKCLQSKVDWHDRALKVIFIILGGIGISLLGFLLHLIGGKNG